MEEKKDYGQTLNLPQTDFQMRGNLPEKEPKILEDVLEKGLYEKISLRRIITPKGYLVELCI